MQSAAHRDAALRKRVGNAGAVLAFEVEGDDAEGRVAGVDFRAQNFEISNEFLRKAFYGREIFFSFRKAPFRSRPESRDPSREQSARFHSLGRVGGLIDAVRRRPRAAHEKGLEFQIPAEDETPRPLRTVQPLVSRQREHVKAEFRHVYAHHGHRLRAVYE